ncbi:MAG: hypothetical protein E6G01_18465, partial [Actinobacteria bacterium]
GLTYTLTLRPGLTYSNGAPVKASDFTYSLERAMKIGWGGKSFFTDYIVGASDYDSGKAPTISGITTDDATGQITIHLTKVYGAFDNVIAFPAAGLVPTGTPMTDQGNSPPPGVGSYAITNVVPNQSFTMQKNSRFNIPGIPQGHLQTINVHIQSNTLTEAQQVLNNQADNFDAGDTVPPTLLNQIQSSAASRFAKETVQQRHGPPGREPRPRPSRAPAPGQRLPDSGLLLPAAPAAGPPDGTVPVRRPQRRS